MADTDFFSEAAWDERYGAREHAWSGQANKQLVAQTSALPPGTALDAGCGEGADARWLAARGWRVTAVDFAHTALARAREGAGGVDVEWRHADLTSWTPPAGAFDLVSAQFVHLPDEQFRALVARLAAAVAPGGALLVVGHDPHDDAAAHRPQIAGIFFTAQDVVDVLDPQRWEVVAAEARTRAGLRHEGHEPTVRDIVVHARRRS